MKSGSLLSIKKGVSAQSPQTASDVTAQSPQEVAKRLYGGTNSHRAFGRILLTSAVDRRIDDRTYRLYTLIEACAWKRPFSAGYPELAWAMDCSERAIIRSAGKLERFGYIRIERKHNKRNEYSTLLTGKTGRVDHAAVKEPISDRTRDEVVDSIACVKCRRTCRIGRAGICVICVREDNMDRALRGILTNNPHATLEQIYVSVKAKRSKEVRASIARLTARATA